MAKKKSSSSNSAPRSYVNLFCMIAVAFIAIATLLNWILGAVGGSAGKVGQILLLVAQIIAYTFICLRAWRWARHKPLAWKIIYFVCAAIVIVCVIGGSLNGII